MIFDRELVRLHRGLASAFSFSVFVEVASIICERVAFLFPKGCADLLILGCRDGMLADRILRTLPGGCNVLQCDISYRVLPEMRCGPVVVADDDALPFRGKSFDCVVANLVLHNVNSVRAVLLKVHDLLRKGGKFLAATFGSGTMRGIKRAIISAENGYLTPRIQPFHTAYEMLSMFQSCNFANLVVDVCDIEVNYENLYDLFRDLKDMGEGNALRRECKPLTRGVMERAWSLYKRSIEKEHGSAAVPVKFEIITLKGDK